MEITMCCWLCYGYPDSISSSWTRVEGFQLQLPVKRANHGSFVLEVPTQIYVCWTCVFVCLHAHPCVCVRRFVEQNTSAAQVWLVKFLQAVTFWEKLRQPFPLQTIHVILLAERKKVMKELQMDTTCQLCGWMAVQVLKSVLCGREMDDNESFILPCWLTALKFDVVTDS